MQIKNDFFERGLALKKSGTSSILDTNKNIQEIFNLKLDCISYWTKKSRSIASEQFKLYLFG